MGKIVERRRFMSLICIVSFTILLLLPAGVSAQHGGGKMTGQGMKGGAMMGSGMMGGAGSGMMPMMGRCGSERMHPRSMGLMGLLHQWGRYFFTQKDQLGLTQEQVDEIQSILTSHIKYATRKNADRKVFLIEMQELLVKGKIDLGKAKRKLNAVEALNTDMGMEGIRTLEEALAVLTPEQRNKIRALFKESTFIRIMGMGMMQGGMMGPGMMQGMMGRGGD